MHAVPPDLPEPARQHRRLRARLRHRPAARELHRSTATGDIVAHLPRRDRTSRSSNARSRSRGAREPRRRPPRVAARCARAGRCDPLGCSRCGLIARAAPAPSKPRASLPTDRAPGDVRDLQNPAERRRVAAGQPRARLHPGADRRRQGRSADQARAGRPVRPDGARAARRPTASTSPPTSSRWRRCSCCWRCSRVLLPRWRRAPARRRRCLAAPAPALGRRAAATPTSRASTWSASTDRAWRYMLQGALTPEQVEAARDRRCSTRRDSAIREATRPPPARPRRRGSRGRRP